MKEVWLQSCFETGMSAEIRNPYSSIRSLKCTNPKAAGAYNCFALLAADMDREEEGPSLA